MDAKIKRIHNLLEELAEAAHDAFPDFSKISACCDNDGYITFNVIKWEDGPTVETSKRRELFDQTKIGEWMPDYSDKQNQYYKSEGLLLKD